MINFGSIIGGKHTVDVIIRLHQDSKLEEFADKCVEQALRGRVSDPTKIPEDVIGSLSTGREFGTTGNVDGDIDTIAVYFDEAMVLMEKDREVHDCLRQAFIDALSVHREGVWRKAVVLADTSAAVSNMLPHLTKEGTTSLRYLKGFKRMCLFPTPTMGPGVLAEAMVRNMATRGITIRYLEAKALARLLSGPPLWFTKFFSNIFEKKSFASALYGVFKMMKEEKIGKKLLSIKPRTVCCIYFQAGNVHEKNIANQLLS